MSNNIDWEDPAEIDKWTRDYYKITDESTDAFLIRKGFLADTPAGLVKRLCMGLAWIEPQVTVHTRPLIDEIRAILEEYERRYVIEVEPQWKLGQPLQMPQRAPAPIKLPAPLTDADILQLKKGETLFEQARALHRLQPALDAQAQYKQAQSEKASKPRKLTETECMHIAKHYWDSKRDGTGYGIVKMLAARYNVSTATVNTVARKYKPD